MVSDRRRSAIRELYSLDAVGETGVLAHFHEHAADARIVLAHLVVDRERRGHVAHHGVGIATDDRVIRTAHADIGDDDALASHTFRGVGAIALDAPGMGVLNYDLYLQRLAEKCPNIPMIIEHLDEADVPRSKAFLDGKFVANGV